jgi:hypothetical protein
MNKKTNQERCHHIQGKVLNQTLVTNKEGYTRVMREKSS